MKWMPLAVLVAFLAGCSRPVVVKLGDRFPDSTFVQDQDSAFREGWEWIQQGDPDRAIKLFQLSSAPLEKKHVAFAYAFLAKSRIGPAREQFEKSLAIAPENLEAEIGLASTFEMTGERENAFHIYSRLMARYPDNPRVKNKYLEIKSTATGDYLAQAEKEKAEGREEKYIHALEQASYFSPEVITIQTEIAEFFYQKKKWDRALAHFQDILAKEPRNTVALQRLVDIFETTEKYDRALLTMDELLKIQPGDAALESRKKQIKEKFQLINLPPKFKEIFFKKEVNREDLAALIGFYFQDYIKINQAPVILTDIDTSYARDEIIKMASAGIIRERPNHTFDRFSLPDRATFSEILNTLLAYLEKRNLAFLFPPKESADVPLDISPEHKNYHIITFLIQSQIITLNQDKNFNPTATVSPTEVVSALQKILNSIIK